MEKYYIEKVEKTDISITDELWNTIEPLKLDENPWEGFETNINTTVKIVYSEKEITVQFETDEKHLRADVRENGGEVCADSCVEFFFGPDKTRYINIEVNPLGIMVLGVNEKDMSKRFKNGNEILNVSSMIRKSDWKLQFSVPFEFINKELGELKKSFYGNFHKCGRETGHRHYMCWKRIETETPKFHSPEFFGELVFK